MDTIKLQKYFTDCGILSRRAAEDAIERGAVRVNGEIATLGTRIAPSRDLVEYEGRILRPSAEEKICILLNKPRGYVTTLSDEKGIKLHLPLRLAQRTWTGASGGHSRAPGLCAMPPCLTE